MYQAACHAICFEDPMRTEVINDWGHCFLREVNIDSWLKGLTKELGLLAHHVMKIFVADELRNVQLFHCRLDFHLSSTRIDKKNKIGVCLNFFVTFHIECSVSGWVKSLERNCLNKPFRDSVSSFLTKLLSRWSSLWALALDNGCGAG